MTYFHPAWLEHQRKRYLRADAYRFAAPGTPEAKPPGWLDPSMTRVRFKEAQEAEARRQEAAAQEEFERGLLELRRDFAKLKLEYELRHFQEKYSPNQPRVPAGNPDGGEWTSEGREPNSNVRLAAGDTPRLGPPSVGRLALLLAKRLIEAYRSENFLSDLFGRKSGTVTYANIDGRDVFGSNSTSPTYTSRDEAAARGMRDVLIQKYPDVMQDDNIGRRPNDALFHAETTILLRAARENGGTLAGRSLEVFSDNPMCASCDTVLPLVGRELGNPTVTFVGPRGTTKTMRDGAWIE